MAVWIMLISLLLIPVGIVVLILALAARRRKDGTPDRFPQIIRTIYMYKVMIISLIMIITGFILVWTNAVNLFLPEPSVAFEDRPQSRYETQEEVWEEEQALNQQRQRNIAIRGLITSFAAIGVAVPVFVYHGKKVKEKK